MSWNYIVEESSSFEQFTLNAVAHKRVYSELNSHQIKKCLEQLDAPMTQSIRENTLRGIYLLHDLITMKQVLNTQQCFKQIQKLNPQKNKKQEKINKKDLWYKRTNPLQTRRVESSLERAEIINSIIQKINSSKDKYKCKKSSSKSHISNPKPNPPIQKHLCPTSNTNLLHLPQNKLFHLSTNESNIQSKSHPHRFETKASQPSFFDQNIIIPPLKTHFQSPKNANPNPNPNPNSIFRKLRNQITKVKDEVQVLKIANQGYIRENHMLRLKSLGKISPFNPGKQNTYNHNQKHNIPNYKSHSKNRTYSGVSNTTCKVIAAKCCRCGSQQAFEVL